jgi:hypothetical protein
MLLLCGITEYSLSINTGFPHIEIKKLEYEYYDYS